MEYPTWWLPRGRQNPKKLKGTPYLPYLQNGQIFDCFTVNPDFTPAIIEVGDGGFIFAEVVFNELGQPEFAVDGHFVIPEVMGKAEFFQNLRSFIAVLNLGSRDFAQSVMMGRVPELEESYWQRNGFMVAIGSCDGSLRYPLMCKVGCKYVQIGDVPDEYLRDIIPFLDLCVSAPLSNQKLE
ncbi:hypothetical protein [Bdellovibrio bacteriovorus]|uniref:hypothetical protein n=1 Tax=Bdellovibrio bacteriovorus TaxID=959 RepID=UPI0035A5E19A